ncbi:CheY-like chemotaxis protein [Desulfobaculum xiamenense]|uniref:CheY-like chemotaxis protein n=1 Tax=Desulfobaculum xiamenense TaxID=995050 RepID=A0A846QIY9_9BACT|nr:hypothetical protein [Desulfobaculum xiamenense]NJB68836.1 CheY-like chemotaxis protein [Desulfobaculum xiamenense]
MTRERTQAHGYTLVVAERNPRIRRFLERELAAEGYGIIAVGDGRELRAAAGRRPRPSAYVVDIEIPYLEEGLKDGPGGHLIRPLVIHALLPDTAQHPAMALAEAVVGKDADPGALKRAVARVLEKFHRHDDAATDEWGDAEERHES